MMAECVLQLVSSVEKLHQACGPNNVSAAVGSYSFYALSFLVVCAAKAVLSDFVRKILAECLFWQFAWSHSV